MTYSIESEVFTTTMEPLSLPSHQLNKALQNLNH